MKKNTNNRARKKEERSWYHLKLSLKRAKRSQRLNWATITNRTEQASHPKWRTSKNKTQKLKQLVISRLIRNLKFNLLRMPHNNLLYALLLTQAWKENWRKHNQKSTSLNLWSREPSNHRSSYIKRTWPLVKRQPRKQLMLEGSCSTIWLSWSCWASFSGLFSRPNSWHQLLR